MELCKLHNLTDEVFCTMSNVLFREVTDELRGKPQQLQEGRQLQEGLWQGQVQGGRNGQRLHLEVGVFNKASLQQHRHELPWQLQDWKGEQLQRHLQQQSRRLRQQQKNQRMLRRQQQQVAEQRMQRGSAASGAALDGPL